MPPYALFTLLLSLLRTAFAELTAAGTGGAVDHGGDGSVVDDIARFSRRTDLGRAILAENRPDEYVQAYLESPAEADACKI